MIPSDVIRVPPDTKLPPHLVVEFWAQVYADLQAKYGLAATDAATAVIRFRADEHRVGDMRYHRDAEQVAQTIATGWQKRLAQPAAPTVPAAPAPTPTTVTP